MGIGAVPDDTTLRDPHSGAYAAAALDPYSIRYRAEGTVFLGQLENARTAMRISMFADPEPMEQHNNPNGRRFTSVDTGYAQVNGQPAVFPRPGPQVFPIHPSLEHAIREGDVPADIAFPHLPGRPPPMGLLPFGG